jgi:ArsR family transcriptional regulator, arsenate/arsenite/antimonite-responsive transcriptional repressor
MRPAGAASLPCHEYFDISGDMETETALACFAALSQPTRLDAFRQLVRAEPEGLAAGELARKLSVPQNTLSAHLNVLSHAALVTSARNGRSVVYRADLSRLAALVRYLAEDCCGGRSDVCAPLIADLTPCCPPSRSDAE